VKTQLIERFCRYARICTTSDATKDYTPSTEGQWELAHLLEKELRGIGISDITLTEHCYLIANLPASPGVKAPCVGFMAHLDTASDVSGLGVQPQLEDDIIRSDGTTLLGADDKAGIAVLVSAAEYFLTHEKAIHGPLQFIFTPDEETGRGLPCLPLELISCKACYTVDGGPEGEVESECFNAWAARARFTGTVTHLGDARGKLVNAALMAATFAAMLPRAESPEATDARYGYYCLLDIKGSLESAVCNLLIRDFDRKRGEERLEALSAFARAVEAQFPGGKVSLESSLQYRNMRDKIAENPRVMKLLLRAAEAAGLDVEQKAIRGGTDGARLTELGIPTPNIWTGGREFHSKSEWLSVDGMAAAYQTIVELVKLWSKVE
jgi:tripeptide aminopeptidase